MVKPKLEQPKLITHGTVESITLQTGPDADADFFFFNGTEQGAQSEGSQNVVCPGGDIDNRCRRRSYFP